jgi:hypothetical protein
LSDETIPPALTPDEWASKRIEWERGRYYAAIWNNPRPSVAGQLTVFIADGRGGGSGVIIGNRHALAALALHGQPFGFTWDDVRTIWACEEWDRQRAESGRPYDWNDEGRRRLRALADRIAALLPPEVS